MQELVERALAFGFSHAALLDAETLTLREEVRDMCAADKCRSYGKSWMCPPACGALEVNRERLLRYRQGLIVQTTGQLEDDYDIETMQETGQLQQKRFHAFADVLRAEYPGLLALSSGTCTLCEACTYPDAPCRVPEKAVPSMEAFGLWVSDVCVKNGLGYNYGPQTITYTSCYVLC